MDEPRLVAAHGKRRVGNLETQLMLHGLRQRARRFDRVTNGAQIDRVAADFERAARDARHVQKVVEQARHVRELAIDHAPRIRRHLRRRARLHQLRRIADRGERISEFVGEGRQELILAAIRLAQLILECAPLRKIADDGDPADGQRIIVPNGRIGGMDPRSGSMPFPPVPRIRRFLRPERAENRARSARRLAAENFLDLAALYLLLGESHEPRIGGVRPDVFQLPVALGHADGHGVRHHLEPLPGLIACAPRRESVRHIEIESSPRTDRAVGRPERDTAAPYPAYAPSWPRSEYSQSQGSPAALQCSHRRPRPRSRCQALGSRTTGASRPARARRREVEISRAHEGQAAGGVRAPHAEIKRFADRAIALFAELERLRRTLLFVDIGRGADPTQDRVLSSRIGTQRVRNQRRCPSRSRSRNSARSGSPRRSASLRSSFNLPTSSGDRCVTTASSVTRSAPTKSAQRGLTYSGEPSAFHV